MDTHNSHTHTHIHTHTHTRTHTHTHTRTHTHTQTHTHAHTHTHTHTHTVATSSWMTSMFLHLANLESASSVTVALMMGADRNHSNSTTPDTHVSCRKNSSRASCMYILLSAVDRAAQSRESCALISRRQ